MLFLAGVVVVSLVGGVFGQTMPSGCTHSKGLYECDYSTLNSGSKIPLSTAYFSNPDCQRLRLTNLPTSLTSAILGTTFYSMTTTGFDTNWPMTLELYCSNNAALSLTSAVLTNAIHVKDFKIINCQVTAGASAFLDLNALDRLTIENGSIASMDATAFTGITVAKLAAPSPSYPRPTGAIVLKDSTVTGGTLPSTLLSTQSKVQTLMLEGLGLTSIDATMFSNCTQLRFLSLGHNSFTELPTGLFDGTPSLTELRLYGTTLDCTCDKLWLYGAAETNRFKIYGDVLCSTPTDYAGKKAMVYYYANCVTVEASCKNLDLMGACITFLELGLYIVCIIGFILSIVVLALTIHLKRTIGGGGGGKGGAKGGARKRPPPKKGAGPKNVKKGWA